MSNAGLHKPPYARSSTPGLRRNTRGGTSGTRGGTHANSGHNITTGFVSPLTVDMHSYHATANVTNALAEAAQRLTASERARAAVEVRLEKIYYSRNKSDQDCDISDDIS